MQIYGFDQYQAVLTMLTFEGIESRESKIEEAIVALLQKSNYLQTGYGTGVDGTNTVCLLDKLCELIVVLATEQL